MNGALQANTIRFKSHIIVHVSHLTWRYPCFPTINVILYPYNKHRHLNDSIVGLFLWSGPIVPASPINSTFLSRTALPPEPVDTAFSICILFEVHPRIPGLSSVVCTALTSL